MCNHCTETLELLICYESLVTPYISRLFVSQSTVNIVTEEVPETNYVQT
jgi:hypothetical protein